MTCPNCDDHCRIPFDAPDSTTKYVACWLCERGQRAMGIGQHFHGADLRRAGDLGTQLLAWSGLPPGFYLHGGVGRGKTYIASAVCRHQASQGRTARFLSSARLLELIKATFDSNPPEDREQAQYALSYYAAADVVVLDDLGAELATDWAEAELTKWIDGFYERDAALLVTSNLSVADLIARLGQRIGSRIIGMTEALELTGPDRRMLATPRSRLTVVRAEAKPESSAEEYAAIRERHRPVLQQVAATLAAPRPIGSLASSRPAAAPRVARQRRLTPEYRAEIEARLRDGEPIPAAWQPFVDEVRAAMQAGGGE